MKNFFIVCASVALLIISSSIAYYFVVVLPQNKKAELKLEQDKAKQVKLAEYSKCLKDEADTRKYTTNQFGAGFSIPSDLNCDAIKP